MLIEGVAAQVEGHADYAEGLHDIESNTHVLVLGWLHRVSRALLASEPARGLFGLRSPARLNPTGLSAAKLLLLEWRLLYLDRFDVVRDLKGQPQDIVVKSFGQEVMNFAISQLPPTLQSGLRYAFHLLNPITLPTSLVLPLKNSQTIKAQLLIGFLRSQEYLPFLHSGRLIRLTSAPNDNRGDRQITV